MKNILLFGAGKSSSACISHLAHECKLHQWNFTVADADLLLIQGKIEDYPWVASAHIDINNTEQRQALVKAADVVISMMPPALHYLIAQDCLYFSKHLLTASYLDEQLKAMSEAALAKDILFLCEMGLDPGIDHMSSMELIATIKKDGGEITSFKSHCGGLVAPESDNNPWHYKVSWNPRNIVLAGKAGARYLQDGNIVYQNYEEVFKNNKKLDCTVAGAGPLAYYANRDSIPYIALYGLQQADTFIRTTLRHPDFLAGWSTIVAMQLTQDLPEMNTQNQTLADSLSSIITTQNNLHLFLSSTHVVKQQLNYLGFDDDTTLINNGICGPAVVLQFALENKLKLAPTDKDMVVMVHQLSYMLDDKIKHCTSSLLVKGEDSVKTAMAKTVGLPLAIAASLVMRGQITLRGVHLPVLEEIYKPVLAALKEKDILFINT